MIAPYKRVLIAILSTTLLHASLFYTLNEVKQPKVIKNKTINIELMQEPKEEIKEVTKEKKQEKVKPVTKTKSVVKPKPIIKPKPIAKAVVKPEPKPIIKPEPIVKTQPQAIEKKEVIEKIVDAPKEVVTKTTKSPITSQESKVDADTKSSTLSANELEIYLYKIRVKIQQNLKYPPLARRLKIQGESVVAFNILSDGSVESSTISTHKSSGNNSLDTQAINTILQLSPFLAPPKGKISIIVPVAFNLK